MLLVWWRPIGRPSRSLAALRCRQLGGSGSHAWPWHDILCRNDQKWITGNGFKQELHQLTGIYRRYTEIHASISILQWHWIIMTTSLPVYFRPKYLYNWSFWNWAMVWNWLESFCTGAISARVRQQLRVWACLRLHTYLQVFHNYRYFFRFCLNATSFGCHLLPLSAVPF